jgi:hypothetical protein
MTVTDTSARGPLSGDALAAARRAALGKPLREPMPMGIRYRTAAADAQPSGPGTARVHAVVSTSTELLEDTDPRPAKPRNRRTATAGPIPAQKAPAVDPVNSSPQPVSSRPVGLDDTPAEPEPTVMPTPEPEPEPAVVPEPEPEPARPSEASTAMPSASAAPVDQQEPTEQTLLEETPAAETIEQILARAAACPSDAVQAAAAALREQAQRLGEALRIEAQAGGLREQIAALDAEIADRTTRRDVLRAELEKLLAGDVTVSADSGPRRAPKAAEVRAWARANGYEISDKGLIPGGIMAAYQRAQDGDQ